MKETIRTRKTYQSDLPYLKVLFAEDGMSLPPKKDLLKGIVAVNADDEPVGFIRILSATNEKNPQANGHYVYPVIVFKDWQGLGIGRLLIEEAYQKYGELKLVACVASRDFYPKCGFEPLEWDEVAHVVAHDCECCHELSTCNPQPYTLKQTSQSSNL